MEEVTAGRIKLAKETERSLIPYEQIIEIGATVEVKWTKEELANTTWTAGKQVKQFHEFLTRHAQSCLKIYIR